MPQSCTPTVRLLLPFYVERNSADDCISALEAVRHRGERLWMTGNGGGSVVPPQYLQELDPVVVQAVVGGQGEQRGGNYARIQPKHIDQWFSDVAVSFKNYTIPLEVRAEGIEIFLSDDGAGLMVVTVESPGPLAAMDCRRLVYRLVQRERVALRPIFRKAHLTDDPAKLDIARARNPDLTIQPAPEDDAAFEARLGTRGGRFHLRELTDWLLAPLSSFKVEAAQQDFGLYAVIHITEAQSMSDVEPLAHSLALLEEPMHASHTEPSNQVTHEYLNSHHAVSLSTHAAIHLVQDQTAPEGFEAHPYNTQRVGSIRMKYFLPYVFALLEKTALTRIDVCACQVLYNDDDYERFRKVRSHLMHLGVTARFSVLSRRSAVQRSYDLCVAALRLPEHRASTRQVITDLADHYHQEQLLHSQHLATESLESGHHIHKALAWVEVAVVAVYGAELYHLVLDDKGFHPANLVAAIGFGLIGLLIVRPWKH